MTSSFTPFTSHLLMRMQDISITKAALLVALTWTRSYVLRKIILKLRNPLKTIPGPWYARFTDWVMLYHAFRGDKIHYLHSLGINYGPVVRSGPNNVFLADADDIRTVLSRHQDFGKGSWFEDRGGPPSLITVRDAKAHASRRRLFGHIFSNSEVRKFEPVVAEKVNLAISQMQAESRREGQVNVLKWFTFMATDVIGDLCFGDSFRMLQRGKKDEYITNIERIMFVDVIRLDLPFIYWFLKITRISSIVNQVDVASFVAYPQKLLNRLREALRASGGASSSERPTFFHNILLDPKQQGLSDYQLVNQAGKFIFAGSDTTSNSLAWLLWLVLSRPAVKQRLCDEVAALPEDYTLTMLQEAEYLNAVLYETMRLYGAPSGDLPRQCSHKEHVFQGYHLPRGTNLDLQTHTLHRSAKYFPQPEIFNPDRWLGENSSPEAKSFLMPFGGGSRTCLGMHLAYMEMRLAIARFFLMCPQAKLASSVTDHSMEIVNYAVNTPQGRNLFLHI